MADAVASFVEGRRILILARKFGVEASVVSCESFTGRASMSCSRLEKILDKCVQKAPKRGCYEKLAKVIDCRGIKICKGQCADEHARWKACHSSVMSVGSYADPDTGSPVRDCAAFVSAFARCDPGWRWPQ